MSDNDREIAKSEDREARTRAAAAVASADAEAAVVHAEGVDDEPVVGNQRIFSGPILIAIAAIAAVYAAFHIFSLNVSALILETWNYRLVHIAGALGLGFLIYSGSRFAGEERSQIGAAGRIVVYGAGVLALVAVAGAAASFTVLEEADWNRPDSALYGAESFAFFFRVFVFKIPLLLAAIAVFFAGSFFDARAGDRTLLTAVFALALAALAIDYAGFQILAPETVGDEYYGPQAPFMGLATILPASEVDPAFRLDTSSFAALLLLFEIVRRAGTAALSPDGRRAGVRIGVWLLLVPALVALGAAVYFHLQIIDGKSWNGIDEGIKYNETYVFGMPLLLATVGGIALSWFHKTPRDAVNMADIVLVICGVAVATYLIVIYGTPIRQSTGTPFAPIGISFAATAGAALIIELTRRVAGLALVVIAAVFLTYVFVGDHLPGFLNYESPTWARFFSQVYTDAGILGPTTAVSSTYIILFIIFAAFLQASKVGDYFVNFAFATAGRTRGGPAKVAVFASGLMGMINGTSAGNVVATGSLTIPLMKKVGYPPKNAGAIEAAASTGGQIMPPIMGAGAFIMAEITEIPYIDITIAAIIPAILYFASILFMIDLQAVKLGMRGMRKDELPVLAQMLRQIYLFTPIIILIYALFAGYSVIRAGAYATAAAAVVSWMPVMVSWLAPSVYGALTRDMVANALKQQVFVVAIGAAAVAVYSLLSFLSPSDDGALWPNPSLLAYVVAGLVFALLILAYDRYWRTPLPRVGDPSQRASRPFGMGMVGVVRAFQLAGVMSIQIIAVCACAGVIVGVISITGVGQRFSSLLLSLAENSQLLALFFAMCISILLGMGMPTTAAYAVAASVVAPGLVDLGIDRLTAHFFVFYFAVISAITPPVALASYAAAGISGSNAMSTSVASFKIGLAAFIVPFMFFYNSALLMQGEWYEIIRAAATAFVGVYFLAAAVEGFVLGRRLNPASRVLLLAAALLMIEGGLVSDGLGVAAAAGAVALQRVFAAPPPAQSSA